MSNSIPKRSSLPSLSMNKFFVSKRASMFEVCEETPKEKRERSPCGVLEVSERKLLARKDEKKKAARIARKNRQADPYAEESTELEEEDSLDIAACPDGKQDLMKKDFAAVQIGLGNASNRCLDIDDDLCNGRMKESKICGHANRAVNLSHVRKYLKQSVPVGQCVHCAKAKLFSQFSPDTSDPPVIWLCVFCGYQGCDRNSGGKHSYLHYRTPRSDLHCIVIHTQLWTVWCYHCDSEILSTSSKKLHEVVQYVKRLSEMAPKRTLMSQLTVSKPTTNLVTQYSGSDSRLYTRRSYEDITKAVKSQKQHQATALASLPKVKGIANLGNTCFFNSVVQTLAQTHFITHLLDVQLQSGQRISLPGLQPEEPNKTEKKAIFDLYISSDDEENEVDLKPLDLILSEGGPLSLAFCLFLKDMHSVCKNGIINPSHLFGQVCKKSTQFQGYQQQDAHELLRCLLDAIRNEEILRIKKAILKAFALNEKTDPNSVNFRLRRLIKEYGKQATHTLIDQIFGGQLISTVFCEECHWSSQVFEPFMDLSLPINEEKGKPKKCSWMEDESIFDCFGRNQNGTSLAGASGSPSKHQQKKQRKEEKRRNHKNRSGKNCTQSSPTHKENKNVEEHPRVSERRARRLTEKRRPEDEEDFRLKEKAMEEERGKGQGTNKKGESSKFLLLSEARNNARRNERSSGEDYSDEDKEYDDDDEEDYLGISRVSLNDNKMEEDKDQEIGEEELEEEVELEEEEEEEEEDENDDDTETETNETESNDPSKPHSKNKRESKETSDADVEDNTDSECVRYTGNNTRHPSIVVDESNTDPLADSEPLCVDSRYLRTNSCDHLNYSSDCSERYFTAAGPDTMDELDNINADAVSLLSDRTTTTNTSTTTSGKGDSISISSVDASLTGAYDENRNPPKVVVEPGHMEEMGMRVGELKIRRKSSSRESLLESARGFKKGSTETLHTFNSMEKINEDGSLLKKTLAMKKLKQEWIARSLTTLATRYQCGRQECSVMSCLTNFTAPELLTGHNKIICENCTKLKSFYGQENSESVRSNASKQLLILSPPAVLTLHLKRFHHVGYNLAKVNRYVQFPLVLDIAPFTSSISLGLDNMSKGQTQVLYGLYGIVEHSGRLNAGHYVAYVRSRPLDTNRTTKQMLNLKPSSQFEINHLVTEMAEKREAEKNHVNGGFQIHQPAWQPLSVETLEEEIRGGRWYHVSDSYVAEVNVEKVLKAQAYLLFYERMI